MSGYFKIGNDEDTITINDDATIYDLPNGLSVPGYLRVGEDCDTISIKDDAVLYGPSA